MVDNESDAQYLLKNGIDNGRIVQRYLSTLRKIESFITVKKIVQNVIIDQEILKTAIYDYFQNFYYTVWFNTNPPGLFPARKKRFWGLSRLKTWI